MRNAEPDVLRLLGVTIVKSCVIKSDYIIASYSLVILDRERVDALYRLLPQAAGSPISESSFAAHVEVSPVTLKSCLLRLVFLESGVACLQHANVYRLSADRFLG